MSSGMQAIGRQELDLKIVTRLYDLIVSSVEVEIQDIYLGGKAQPPSWLVD